MAAVDDNYFRLAWAHVGSRASNACLTNLRGRLPLARLQEPLGRSRSAPCFVGAQVPLGAVRSDVFTQKNYTPHTINENMQINQ